MLIFLKIPVTVSHIHQWFRQTLSSHQVVRGKNKFVPRLNTAHTSEQHTDKSSKTRNGWTQAVHTVQDLLPAALRNVPLTHDTLSCIQEGFVLCGVKPQPSV